MVTPRFARLALVCLALFCIAAVSASAASAKIYTTAASDAYVHSFGDSWHPETWVTTVVNGVVCSNTIYKPPSASSSYLYDWAVFQFPLTNLRGKTLAPNSAKLHVYGAMRGYPIPPNAELLGFTSDGGGVVTTSQTSGVHAATMPFSADEAWQQVDITADLQRQINAGYNWAGYVFSLRDNYNHGYNDCNVLTFTYEDAAHRPYLEVTPEPSGLLALMAGITGIGGMFVRRKK